MSAGEFSSRNALGAPGIEPRWTRSDKQAIVTAYSTSSRVWATLSAGIVNEVYFPSIDTPQMRDLQFLITDGETFFHDERRDTDTDLKRLCTESLWFRALNRDKEGRYEIEKQVITAPHAACLLLQVQVRVQPEWEQKLQLFALLAPHLDVGGCGNSGELIRHGGRLIFVAHRGDNWLAMDCSTGFKRGSCGYVGVSDGWTDLAQNRRMDWEYGKAKNGNIALTGEIDIEHSKEFCLGVAFARNRHGVLTTLAESLAIPFEDHVARFRGQWARVCNDRDNRLATVSGDEGYLMRTSHNMLLAHEDKTFHGAMIASLSIPWGEARGDDNLGGYHLVWPRDMVHSATALMAAGETATPFRALIYLSASQRDDGGFFQNFWIDGRAYWHGIQLDEVAFPILLAWKLKEADALQQFDPYPLVRAAACYLVQHGPATHQERWEENSGYSPSTLAVHIAALICASEFAKQRGDTELADYWRDYADFLEQHVERWTVTDQGSLLSEVPRHYIRLLPVDPSDPHAAEDPNSAEITIRNRAGDLRSRFPAKDVVDAGFLELVRYGVRKAGDALIEDSLRVVDSVLKVDTPGGVCWRRYNHDGYGQRADGGPFLGAGQGRAWPLLTGERAHYELAAGRDCSALRDAMEYFAGPTGLLPEQVWDAADLPEARLKLGGPTGSAMPLMWAHAEYIKLLRSLADGRVFDRIEAVYRRYAGGLARPAGLEIWKFNRRPRGLKRGDRLRIQTQAAFRLRWSIDHWQSYQDSDSDSPGMGIHYVDISPQQLRGEHLEFTFYWLEKGSWEGPNFAVELV